MSGKAVHNLSYKQLFPADLRQQIGRQVAGKQHMDESGRQRRFIHRNISLALYFLPYIRIPVL